MSSTQGDTAGDDVVVFEGPNQGTSAGGGAAAPKPSLTYQVLKATDTLFTRVLSSATVAALRVFTAPPQAPLPPNAETLPKWYIEDYQRRSRFMSYGKQYVRDTVLLTAATYIMEGVEYGSKTVRGGTDDVLNKILGGTAAGGFMGFAWFPSRFPARLIMTSAGAVVGYVSYVAEKTSRAMLLEQQQTLEREILGASDDKVHKELDPQLLRDLLRRKQKQLLDAAEANRKGDSPGGNGVPGKPSVPAWVNRTLKGSPAGTAPTGVLASTTPPGELKQDSWLVQPSGMLPELETDPPRDDYPAPPAGVEFQSFESAESKPTASAVGAQGPRAQGRGGGWGGWFGGAQGQGGGAQVPKGRARGPEQAPEMVIREEEGAEPAFREDPPR